MRDFRKLEMVRMLNHAKNEANTADALNYISSVVFKINLT